MMAAPSTSNKGNDIMSKSLTNTSPAINSPKTPQPVPKMQSNFKRTSSLRISNRKPKPVIYTPPVKSNIHCGITDDGPISPNFVKATDYDELPIKSPYSAIKLCEQNILNNQVPSRASPSPTMPSIINKPMMREKSALIRKNLRLDLTNPNMPSSDYPLSKTDSLALFLKYENELTAKMSEKELKDKSNSLSKRSQGTMNLNSSSMMDQKLPDINYRPIMQQQQPQQKFTNGIVNDERPLAPIENTNKNHPDDSQAKSHSAPSKISNACDNLPLLTNGIGEEKSRSPSIDRKTTEEESPNSTRRSGGTTLRRKKKYNMDNILFDTDPEVKTPPSSDNSNNNSLKRPESRTSNTESIFEDFDFDQFVASFNDDDQFPIFKDYKMLLNKSAAKADEENNNSKNSAGVHHVTFNNGSNKTPPTSDTLDGVVKNLSESKPIPIQQQQRSEAEISGLEKLDNLCKMLSGNSDSDESNSLETDPSELQTARSKSSADSAYGR